MSASAAGLPRVVVKVSADDSAFQKTLQNASKRLSAFGKSVTATGKKISSVGAIATAPFAAAAYAFASAGDALHKMSIRTGFAASELSALTFAASQSGSSIGELENGFKALDMQFFNAARGSKEAAQAFEKVGLSYADLQKMSRSDQLRTLADAFAKIDDAAQRAALAQKLFGGAGTKLLPLLTSGAAGLDAMTQKAAELGLVMSDQDADAAAALTDAMDVLKRQFGALANVVGAAISGPLTGLLTSISGIAATVIKLVDNNRGLVAMVAAIAAGVLALGTALVGTGLAASALAAGLAGLAALAGALVSPVGLVVLAVAGLAAQFFMATRAGGVLVDYLKSAFSGLFGQVATVVKAIGKALASGNWEAAATVAMSAVKVVFYEALAYVANLWNMVKGAAADTWADLKGGVELMAISIKHYFSNAWDYVLAAFYTVQKALNQAFWALVETIAAALNKVGAISDNALKNMQKRRAYNTQYFDAILKPFQKLDDDLDKKLEEAARRQTEEQATARKARLTDYTDQIAGLRQQADEARAALASAVDEVMNLDEKTQEIAKTTAKTLSVPDVKQSFEGMTGSAAVGALAADAQAQKDDTKTQTKTLTSINSHLAGMATDMHKLTDEELLTVN